MRDKVYRLTENTIFQNVIIGLIIINAMILGAQTYPYVMESVGGALLAIDKLILLVFVIELALRLYAHRLQFFRQPWSLFDFFVVAIALAPATGPLAVLRTLRVLRVLRLLSTVPSLRKVIEGLLRAIPGIAAVALVMSIFFYVFAVIGTNLYGSTYPVWFGSLGASMFTLFQIMTLESWSMGIVRPIMEQHPHAWLFFVTYILVSTFTMLNLFIGIIVNAMHSDSDEKGS